MKKYLLICEETCPSCQGEGINCLVCQCTGKIRSEVSLAEALKALRSKRQNTSGMPGVSLGKTVRKGKVTSYAWNAQIRIDGRYQNRSWAILTHGYKGAFALAAAERANHTGQTITMCPKPTEELELWAEERGLKL